MLLLWWYSDGLLNLIRHVREQVRSFSQSLNLQILTKYLFVPMYGYNDIGSRVISFSVRLVQLVVITMTTMGYILLESLVIVLWLSIPVVVLGNILYQLGLVIWPNL